MANDDTYGQMDPARVLDANYWRFFSLPAEPTMRDKILAITIDDIGRVGHTSFNAKFVCEVLEIAPSLINHHFGGRDELIAEAAVVCYGNYVNLVWQTVDEAPRTPRDRLRAWIDAQLFWTARMSGWGPILNYPKASLAITSVIEDRHRTEFTAQAELHMARLLVLVGDVKRGTVSNATFTAGHVPRLKLLRDARVVGLAASIGWSTLGLAVWNAGRHLPTGELPEPGHFRQKLMRDHVERIIDQID